jgi:hypothetical protein
VAAVARGEVTNVADGLDAPAGVALAQDGTCFVADEGAGALLRLAGGERTVLLDGLDHPQGVALAGDDVYVVEAGAKRLLAVGATRGEARQVAAGLPVGKRGGGVRDPLPGLHGPLAGPVVPFAALASDTAGRLYVGGDEIGSVVVLERDR